MEKTDISPLELPAVIDIPALRGLLESLYQLIKLPLTVLDLKGTVLIAAGWEDICLNFHRKHPISAANCSMNDLNPAEELKQGEFMAKRCKNQLWELITPIYISGKHAGNIYAGQFFYDDEEIDEEFFIRQAGQCGFNREAYLDALHRVPRFSRERIDDIIQFVRRLSGMISEMSYTGLQLQQNLSSQLRATKILQNSYSHLFNSMRDAVITTNLDGAIKEYNEHFLNMLGYTPEQMETLTLQDITPEKWRALDADIQKNQVLQQGYSQIYEKEYVRNDGSILPVELRSALLTDGEGGPSAIWSIVRDISDRKRADNDLRKSNRLLEAVIKQAPFAIHVLEGDLNHMRLVINNQEFERIMGQSGEELAILNAENPEGLTCRFFSIDGKQEIPLANMPSPRAFRGEQTINEELIFRHPDGAEIMVQANSAPIYGDDNNIIAVLSTLQDITGRKHMERSIAESELQLRTLLQTIPDLIWLKEPDGVYLTCNRTFERFFGAPADLIQGKTDYDFIDKNLADAFRENDCEAIETGEPSTNEEVLIFAADEYQGLFEILRTPMYDTEGKLIGVLGIARDISSRKKAEDERRILEERLQQSYKIEAIGALAGGIAHDFNNILAALLGFTELAKMKYHEQISIENELDKIHKASLRARELVKQILTFSRQSGIKREPLLLVPILEEAIGFIRASLPSTIEIRHDFPSAAYKVLADATQMHQVLINLCTNAAYAMKEEGGVIDIQLTRLDLDEQTAVQYNNVGPGRYIQLNIKDTGCGMCEETQKRIFDPFFTTKKTGEGSGIGLSVVHGIVRSMDGDITVSSKPGQGSSFHVILPLYDGNSCQKNDDENEIPALQTGNAKILFVDDEADVISSVGEILTRLGYTVVSTTNPFDALQRFEMHSEDFDLVLTDFTMPGMTGLELAEKLHRLNPGLPVILSTGLCKELTITKLQDAGIFEMVMKPLSVAELSQTVHKALHQSPE